MSLEEIPEKAPEPTPKKPKKPRKKKFKRPVLRSKWSDLHEAFLAMTNKQCRYPLIETEEHAPFTFCTKPTSEGSSYCEEHRALCEPRKASSLFMRIHWKR